MTKFPKKFFLYTLHLPKKKTKTKGSNILVNFSFETKHKDLALFELL